MNVESILVCPDCHTFLAGDLTSFDYYYDPIESDAKIAEIADAVTEFRKNADKSFFFVEDSENDQEFSKCSCAVCKSSLAGARYSFNLEPIR